MKISKSVISILIVLLFSVLLIFSMRSFDDAKCEYLNQFLAIKFIGVVQSKFIDSSEHSYPTIFISDTSQRSQVSLNLLYDTTNLYNILNIGDSVFKPYLIRKMKVVRAGKIIYDKEIDFGCE